MPPNGADDVDRREPAELRHRTKLSWTFALNGSEVGWLWQRNGDPPLDLLEAVRTPTASALNRHIAVTAYSVTNDGTLALESGLEHDLLRRLDRDPSVAHIVAQPFRLSWRGGPPNKHIPDLLTKATDGAVTVWDVRAPGQQDADFESKAKITSDACRAVGWTYEIFGGLEVVERLNLLWLHGFRRRPAWAPRCERQVLDIVSARRAVVRDVFTADDGSGELKSTMWHMIWSGALDIDMSRRWTLDTAIGPHAMRAT